VEHLLLHLPGPLFTAPGIGPVWPQDQLRPGRTGPAGERSAIDRLTSPRADQREVRSAGSDPAEERAGSKRSRKAARRKAGAVPGYPDG
jgi:hypothetical protein